LTDTRAKRGERSPDVERAAPPVLDPVKLRLAVQAEQIRYLYRTPVAMLVNLINAPIVAIVVGRFYPSWAIIAWLVLFVLFVGMRTLVWRAYQRRPQPPETARSWARRYLIGSCLTGCLWGLAGSIIFMTPDSTYHVFVAFVLAGMCAGAVSAQAAYLPSVIAFVIPTILPCTLAFLSEGSVISVGMAFLGLVFVGALILIGRAFSRSLADSYRLQIENAALIRNLTTARDAAEAASRTKSRFLAHMSHELRTPLNAIIGFSEMFMSEAFGPLPNSEYRTYSRYTHDSALHLLAMIKDILDLSRAEAGSLELEEEILELPALVEVCLQMIATRGREAGVAIERSLADPLPRLRADAGKLRQILINLFSNAIKFTPAGGRVRVAAATDAEGAVVLTVTDTGIGMSPRDIPQALTPFVQLDDKLAKRYEGMGLGLPLAKHFAERHGGTLTVESRPGEGTTVTVRFPPERSIFPSTEPHRRSARG
jgi:signal transduction histidine kinase